MPDTPAGRLVSATGEVARKSRGAAKWLPLEAGGEVLSSDLVSTRGGKAVFEFPDGVRVYMNESTVARLEYIEGSRRLHVESSEAYFDDEKPVEVRTADGTARPLDAKQ